MEPSPLSDGDWGSKGPGEAGRASFNGAVASQRRRSAARSGRAAAPPRRFNGAVASQRRRYGSGGAAPDGPRGASMEPSPLSDGDSSRSDITTSDIASSLQWS